MACRTPNLGFFLKPLGTVGQIALIKCDITDPQQVAAALTGADAVINLVGILHGHFEDAHVVGAENIAKAAADAGVATLVHISAIGADSGIRVPAMPKARPKVSSACVPPFPPRPF